MGLEVGRICLQMFLFIYSPVSEAGGQTLPVSHRGAGGDAQAGACPLAGTRRMKGRHGSVAVHLLQEQSISPALLWAL